MWDQIWLWVGFNSFVLLMLALDLGVFHRKAHVVQFKEAVAWSGVWITLALLFNVAVYFLRGPQAGLEFLTGYLIEKSLSVDNIFVILLIFGYFRVPALYQHKVLFWGILGALLMRAILILVGAALIKNFHWVIYLFGAFLVLTAVKMALQKETGVHPERNPLIRLLRRFMPTTAEYHGEKFFVKQDGRTWATPLFAALLVVEFSDLVFAIDSIPAIFAVTNDTFIVYTSNVFAILGLRSMFFALAGFMGKFHYLKLGLALVLGFVGAKMLLVDVYKIPVGASLGIIALILTGSVVLSLLRPKEEHPADEGPAVPLVEAHPEPAVR
ncbi:MAG TPA: TerC family protein [Armatimonadota bacterium]|nr:TerC family protein [Armatimonadota bacterium]